MIKVGIVGSTGYAGNELVRILSNHPEVKITWLVSNSYEGRAYADLFGNMTEILDIDCIKGELEDLSEKVDLIFTATPQGYLAGAVTDKVLENSKVIDLSADFRIKDVNVYEEWYNIEHKRPDLIEEAVYGLCEINRDKINKDTRLIANPGCYTTTSIVALYPLVKEGIIDPDSIIIDAKSGATGAGRGAKTANLFCEVNESVKAYSVGTHRHTPEIEEQLGYACGRDIKLIFTPHLIPMERGIIATCYGDLAGEFTEDEVRAVYEKYYGDEKFIRLLKPGVITETRWVRGSNYLDVNFKIEPRTGRIIAFGALDNIVKGAAGQAVQNMNILFGFPEDMGLNLVPLIV